MADAPELARHGRTAYRDAPLAAPRLLAPSTDLLKVPIPVFRPAFSSVHRVLSALALFTCLTLAALAVPAAPSGLRGVVTGSTTITLVFDDNSTTPDEETNFEIVTSFGTFTPAGHPGTGTISTGFSMLFANTAYTFKVRAYIGTTANASPYSNTITVTTADFNAPNSPVAVTQASGVVLVTWTDNAVSEAGYFVEYSGTAASGPFTVAGSPPANFTGFFVGGLAPATTYYFRVRGFKGPAANPTALTAYSSPVVSATTPAVPVAPTGLTATATGERAVLLAFTDNSANNTGYEIWLQPTGGGSGFSYLGDAGDVSSISTGNIFAPGTGYDFAVRAYYQNGANPRLYSAFSNIASATTPFNAPTGLTVTPSATSPYLISFAWTDNSSAETGYELEFRQQGAPFFASRKVVAANTASIANLPEFLPGTVYEFRIHALSGNGGSAYFPAAGGVAATTRNGFSSKPYAPIQVGTFFSYQMATISQSARTSWSASGLPPGLGFDSASGVISGTPTTAGVSAVTMTANFASGPAHVLPLMLRVLTPPAAPQITAVIGAQTLTQGGTGTIALDTKFADPDTESAVRMVTTKGNVDIALYSATTPQTVANFNSYNYTDVLFHRAPANFVVQGGGFKTYAAPNVFEHIATAAAVANEPGISNTVGTVAMAKVGDDPNSATSEFFFNVNDNSGNLDNQNGGFTVFGRVAAPSLNSTLFALATAPVANYPVQLHTGPGATDYTASTFTDLPIDQLPLPAAVDQNRLVKVTSVTALPVLTYVVTANTNPSAASAVLAGSSLQLTALAPGVTSITVSATDVDGNVTPQTFTVTVQQTFAQWAAANGTTPGATDNPDQDALTNLQEWAFFGNPGVPDGGAHLPTFALTPGTGARFVEITFPVRKFTANLTYSVEASSTLANDWTTIWTSTQGFAVPAVTAAVNQSDRTVVTVRDTVSTSATARRFLRAKVQ